ncbi:MAG: lasso peptide biosynthesis PqqD family chaperone [Gammaproteobacteria bacterium]
MAIQTNRLIPTATLKRNEELISSEIDGETVMMSLEQGKYYGLDVVGSRVWDLLSTPQTLNDIVDALLIEFDVDRETCESDVSEFVERMLKNKLLIKE